MSDYTIKEKTLNSIAKAIRIQEQSSGTIKVSDFASRIAALDLGFQQKTGDITGEGTQIYGVQRTTVESIANAIRAKEGSSGIISVDDFAERILHLVIAPGTVSWANSPWEDIAALLEAHYSGMLNISDYFSIGDIRYTQWGAYPQLGLEAQQIGLRIVDFGTNELDGSKNKNAITLQFSAPTLQTMTFSHQKTEFCYLGSEFDQHIQMYLMLQSPSELYALTKSCKVAAVIGDTTSGKSLTIGYMNGTRRIVCPCAREIDVLPKDSDDYYQEGRKLEYYKNHSTSPSVRGYWLRSPYCNGMPASVVPRAAINASGKLVSSFRQTDVYGLMPLIYL